MKPYDPTNWYWYVAGDTTKVFSSSVGDYVLTDNAAFLAWSADGTMPTNTASEADLGETLAPSLSRPVNANVLDRYKDTHAGNIVRNVVFKILFNHENRLRTIERALSLNGSPANLTANQAKAAVKALM